MKRSLLLILATVTANAETLWFNNGKNLEGTIVEADNTHVLFKRGSDLQMFRFPTDLLTVDSKKLVELYHNTNRYGEIPRVSTPLDDRTLRRYAEHIDGLLKTRLRTMRLTPNKKADEHTRLRRLYLTVVGRIPTENEIKEYMDQPNSGRWDKEVVKLLNSPGYVNHQLNWLYDLLRVQDNPFRIRVPIGYEYRHWLREQVELNTPYDKFVHKLLNSSGDMYAGGDARASGYYLRDRGMKEDNLSLTVRAFLGTRMQCAMCHDHPFDRWTQREFYEMTAFVQGMGNVTNKYAREAGRARGILRRRAGEVDERRYQRFGDELADAIQFGMESNGTGELILPESFMGSNAAPGDKIHAKAIFTPKFDLDVKERKSRLALADWLTDPNNPRFTTVIANRLWKRVFGVGLYEPVDNFMDDTMPLNSDLMWYLERLMVSVNYDLKEFYRILLNTDLFSREVQREDSDITKYEFRGPKLRRMTGEQVWDSLVTLVYNDIDEPSRLAIRTTRYGEVYVKYKEMTSQEMVDDIVRLAEQNPDARSIIQLLPESNYTRPNVPNSGLVRSTYLQSPVPGGHLIRQFGGSDRTTIENSNSEPNTTQVLNLLNGFVEKNILNNRNADFIVSMKKEKNKSKQVQDVFLAVLGRKPSSSEVSDLTDIMEGDDGYKHVAWILLNTHEFMFIY